MFWSLEIVVQLGIIWLAIWFFARNRMPGFWTIPWWGFLVAIGEAVGITAYILMAGYQEDSIWNDIFATIGGALALFIVCRKEYYSVIATKITVSFLALNIVMTSIVEFFFPY
jgi:hypothetical protein